MLHWIYYFGWWVLGVLWLVGLCVFTAIQLRREFGVGQERTEARVGYRLWPPTGPYRQTGWEIVPDVIVQGELAEVVHEGAHIVPGLGEGIFRFVVTGGKLYVTALRAARLNGQPLEAHEAQVLANDDTVEVGGTRVRVEVKTP